MNKMKITREDGTSVGFETQHALHKSAVCEMTIVLLGSDHNLNANQKVYSYWLVDPHTIKTATILAKKHIFIRFIVSYFT